MIQYTLNFLGIFHQALLDYEVKDIFMLFGPFLSQHNQINSLKFLENYRQLLIGLQA
jgi:hypothetical protein